MFEFFKTIEDKIGRTVHCKGGTTVTVPGPTQEEIQLQRYQLQEIQRQQAEQAMLAPYLYQGMGYKYNPAGGVNPEYAALQQQLQELQNQPHRTGIIGDLLNQVGGRNERIAALQAQMSRISPTLTEASLTKMSEDEYYNTLNTAEKRKYDIQKALEERQQKAIAGTLELDPLATQKIEEREASLRNLLSARVGSQNVETSQAWKDWQQEKVNMLQSMRRGEISTGEALMLQGQGAQLQNTQFGVQEPMTIAGRGTGTFGMMSQALQPYTQARQMALQAGMANAQSKAASSAGFGKLLGTVGTIGGMMLAPYTGGASLALSGLAGGLASSGGGGGAGLLGSSKYPMFQAWDGS